MLIQLLRNDLEALYAKYNRRVFIPPDPLQFVLAYEDDRDREVVGLIAACLAFGNVKQIAASVGGVLNKMPRPYMWLRDASDAMLRRTFNGFRHRFVDGGDLCDFLGGMRRALDRHGTLRACFLEECDDIEPTFVAALTGFARQMREGSRQTRNYLVPSPSDGSACKRLNLFLRWMIRRDKVDPGVWAPLPASKLVIPLDTHMHRIALQLGFTRRKQGDLRTAIEVTKAFRRIVPDDPVRYDFTLTRMGMANSGDLDALLKWTQVNHPQPITGPRRAPRV